MFIKNLKAIYYFLLKYTETIQTTSNGHFSVGFEDWPNFVLHYFGLENLNVVDNVL